MPRSCPGGGWAQLELTDALETETKNRILSSGKPQYGPHKGVTLPSGRGEEGGGAVFSMTIARCNFRRRKLNFNAIFLGSSSSERDAEATRAHARTRPHDTFSRFAILVSPFLVFASWG